MRWSIVVSSQPLSSPFPEEEWEDDLHSMADSGDPGIPVCAMYDYRALEDDEFSFKKGDIFEKLEDEDDQGWCKGRKDGRLGLFPAGYVKDLPDAIHGWQTPKAGHLTPWARLFILRQTHDWELQARKNLRTLENHIFNDDGPWGHARSRYSTWNPDMASVGSTVPTFLLFFQRSFLLLPTRMLG